MKRRDKEKTMEFWGMKSNYYSFDFKGCHFVILDANYLRMDNEYKDYQCTTRYPQEIYDKYPAISKMAPYEDPLFAFVTNKKKCFAY